MEEVPEKELAHVKLKNMESYFCALSPEDQYKLIVPIIMASDSHLKWRLKVLINSLETPDLISSLPPEIQLKIFSYVDGTSLLKACCVSKVWNQILDSFKKLWRSKCIEIGVNINEKPSNISWKSAYTSSTRQLKSLETDNAFSDMYINLQNSQKAVSAVDYNNGFLCAVTEEGWVNIWHLELNFPVLTFHVDHAVSCVKFHAGSTLVCGHLTGILSSWDISDANDNFTSYELITPENFNDFSLLKVRYEMHHGPVFSCDFSEELDLLVSGGCDECIKFWSLRTGELLHTIRNISHWVLRVILLPYKYWKDRDGGKHCLLTMTRDSANKYEWLTGPPLTKEDSGGHNSPCGEPSLSTMTATVKLNESRDNFITPGLQVSSKWIGLVKQDLQEKEATLELRCIDTFEQCIRFALNFKVRKLLALGDRFAMLLTVGKALYTSTLIVLDVHSGKTVATHTIPHSNRMTTPDGAQIIVGDTDWLNGLKGWEFFAQEESVAGPFTSQPVSYESTSDHCSAVDVSCYCKDLYGSNCVKCTDVDIFGDSLKCGLAVDNSAARFKRQIIPGKKLKSLVLAAGVRSEEGRVFTLWLGQGGEAKTKTE